MEEITYGQGDIRLKKEIRDGVNISVGLKHRQHPVYGFDAMVLDTTWYRGSWWAFAEDNLGVDDNMWAYGNAIDEDGEAEYKSTTGKTIGGAYNGISVQKTWEEQERYLKEDKIGKYKIHYFARFDGGKIAEIWRLTGKDVLSIVLPKLRKSFDTVLTKKDPRLGASVSKTEIINYGIQVYEAA